MDTLTTTTTASLPDIGADLIGTAESILDAELSPETRRAYSVCWDRWSGWARNAGLDVLPAAPAAVVLFLAGLASGEGGLPKLSTSSINKHAAAIARAHTEAGLESPTTDRRVRGAMKGIRRTYGAPARRKMAADLPELLRLLGTVGGGHAGARDRALLLIAWTACLRRSEVVAMDLQHIEQTDAGIRLTIPSSKTDQEHAGTVVGIPAASRYDRDPVRALLEWVELAGIERGPLWRRVDRWGNIGPGRLTAGAVALIVKRAAERAGLDPAKYAGHSLRSGFITEAAAAGLPDREIKRQSRHKSSAVLHGYIRRASVFNDNPAGRVLG